MVEKALGNSNSIMTKLWEIYAENIHAKDNMATVLYISFIKLCRMFVRNCQKGRKKEMDVFVHSSQFVKNKVSEDGGAIFISTNVFSSSVKLTVITSEFIENTADNGGAISSSALTLIKNSVHAQP